MQVDRLLETPLGNLLLLCLYVVLIVVPACRLVSRLGFHGAWGLLSLVPVVNVLGLWLLAFARWPRHRRRWNGSGD